MSNSTVQTIVFLVITVVMFFVGVLFVVEFDLDPIPPGLGIGWGLVTVIVSTGAAILVYRENKNE